VFSLVVGGFIESALVAAGAVRWQAGLALATAAGLVGTAWAGASLGLGGREVLLLFSGVGALRLAAGLGLVAWKVGLGGREDRWRGWREFMGYSLPVWLNDAVGSLSRYVDRFVVLCFFSAAVFSHYHLGAVEVPISLLLTAVVTVLVPEVSRLYREERLAEIGVLWKQAVGRLALIVVPFFCFLFVFAEPLIELYLTSRYSASRWVFRIFLLTLPLRCAVYNPLLVGMGMARWALWGSLGDLLLNTSLSIALVQVLLARQSEWAFLGPAVAAVMATYAQVLFLVGVIAHRLRWGLGQLLPWGDLLRIGVFSGLAAAAGWWVSRLADGSVTRLMLAAGGFGVALAGLLGSSAPAREELKAIFRGLGRG
jgi:O-antigen/teichoic acid export membrane protein